MALDLVTCNNWRISVFHSTYDIIPGTTASYKMCGAQFKIKLLGPLFKLQIPRWQQQSMDSFQVQGPAQAADS